MDSENKTAGVSLEITAVSGGDFSLSIETVNRNGEVNSHRVLRISISKDGSIYLLMMKMQDQDKEWQINSSPITDNGLTRDFDLSCIGNIGTAITPKFSFHASGAINFGQHRAYRPPLRTIRSPEQLCLLQYGNPADLPVIDIEKFNSWKKKKKHPLLPMGIAFPGGVLATRVYASGPDELDLKKLISLDFEMTQMNYLFRIRGLPNTFPQSKSGDYGYDLWLATGQWSKEKWKGPMIAVPTINPNDDPEACRETI